MKIIKKSLVWLDNLFWPTNQNLVPAWRQKVSDFIYRLHKDL